MIRRGLMMRHKGEEYIKDGLVFWLDGRQQGGQPNKWIDLIQNIPFDLVDCVSNEDNVQFDGNNSYGYNTADLDKLYFDSRLGTIEIAAINSNPSYSAILAPPIASNNFNFCLFTYGGDKMQWQGNLLQPQYVLVDKTIHTLSLSTKLGYNNKQKIDLGAAYSWNLGENVYLIGARGSLTNRTRPFKGNIYAIRIYNRQLTEEEILHNQQLDIDNYFGGVIE